MIKKQKYIYLEEPTVNLTPLIDVVFVVLIIFILIAPMLEMEKIELAQASPHSLQTTSLKEASSISIAVDRNNTIWLNHQKISLIELKKELRVLKALYPHSIPQLLHDYQAHFGVYQDVKSALEEAEFQELDVILKPT